MEPFCIVAGTVDSENFADVAVIGSKVIQDCADVRHCLMRLGAEVVAMGRFSLLIERDLSAEKDHSRTFNTMLIREVCVPVP